jgi:hypothetical protein
MALNDRYYRDDGRIQALDRYLTRLGDRVGNAWLIRTGVNRSVLTQTLYLVSAWAAAQQFVFFWDPYAIWVIGLALFGFMGITASRGGVVEQMQMEVLRLPKNSFAFLRIFLLSMGLLSLAQVAGSILAGVLDGSGWPEGVGSPFFSGCAFTALQVSEYIRRTNPATPRGGHWVS